MSKLEGQLAALATMSSAQLRTEWGRVFRDLAPALAADLLLRGLAYRLQERSRGGLCSATKRRVRRLCQQLESHGEIASVRDVTLKPGTRLVRDWQGRSHHVLVLDDGYLIEDRRYSSLTRIACDITGANWSGPRFFGLKRRSRPFAEGRADG